MINVKNVKVRQLSSIQREQVAFQMPAMYKSGGQRLIRAIQRIENLAPKVTGEGSQPLVHIA